MLQHAEHVCEYGRQQECTAGTKGRSGRDDGTHRTSDILQAHPVDGKGSPVLYVKLQKALYGLMRASLLFYQKLRKELEEYGS